ncbi:Putative metallophosphoesterase F40B5.2 [Toxocara canis]|uniref:Putative metallophosphoesterase F40B5.2 n=1 Tax=Toxocara canis TaxID=6265 RepID=A0A0B2VT64_TOXCA|nr:Putative metallophosphoesterase F40B5.2 [Toxocara canis]
MVETLRRLTCSWNVLIVIITAYIFFNVTPSLWPNHLFRCVSVVGIVRSTDSWESMSFSVEVLYLAVARGDMSVWLGSRWTSWECGGVLLTVEVCLVVSRLLSRGMYHAQLVRIHDILHIELVMCLSSVLVFRRMAQVLKGHSRRVRFSVRTVLLTFLLLCHVSWTLFYLYIPDESVISVICFTCLAIYLHVACFLALFYMIELVALRVRLPQYLTALMRSKDKNTAFSVVFSVLLVLIGLAVTRFSPVVRRVNVVVDDLPQSLNDFSIALLTDVHIGPTVGRERIRRIVSMTNALQPSAVAIAGDLVDGFIQCHASSALPLADLRSKYGTFYVTGNHEYYHSDVDEWLKFFAARLNMTLLRNSNVKLYSSHGDYLCMGGVDDFLTGYKFEEKLHFAHHRMDGAKALQGCEPNAPSVLLVHQPNGAERILRRIHNQRIDLILSGHTHGGQFYIFWPFAYLKNAYLYGLYRVRDSSTQIYVSPGVNYWGPPVKMINLCEISLIRLKSSKLSTR